MSDRTRRRLERELASGDLRAGAQLLHLLVRSRDPRLVAAGELRRTLRGWLFAGLEEAGAGHQVVRFSTLAEVLREGLESALTPSATFAFRRLAGQGYYGLGMFACRLDGELVRVGLRAGGGGKTLASYWPERVKSFSGKGPNREAKLRELEGAENVLDVPSEVVEDLLRFEELCQPNDYSAWFELDPTSAAPEREIWDKDRPSKTARKKLAKLQKEHGPDTPLEAVLWELTGTPDPEQVHKRAFNAALVELERLVSNSSAGQHEIRVRAGLAAERTRLLGEPELRSVVEALTTTGGGRLAVVREAIEAGTFADERLMPLVVLGLSDPISELGEVLATVVAPAYKAKIAPLLAKDFDPGGDRSHGLRLRALGAAAPARARKLAKQALGPGASEHVSAEAVEVLAQAPGAEAQLKAQARSKKAAPRAAARRALAARGGDAKVDSFRQALQGADVKQAPALLAEDKSLRKVLIEEARAQLEALVNDPKSPILKKIRGRAAGHMRGLLECFRGARDAGSRKFLLACWDERATLRQLAGRGSTTGEDVLGLLVEVLARSGQEPAADALLEGLGDLVDPQQVEEVLVIAVARKQPEVVYERFAPLLRAGGPISWAIELLLSLPFTRTLNRFATSRGFWGHEGIAPLFAPERLDPRWLDLAVEMQHVRLTAALSRPGHSGATTFLKGFLDGSDWPYDKPETLQPPEVTALLGLAACEPPNLPELAASMYRNFVEGGLDSRLIETHRLPPTVAPALEALAPECHDEWDRDQLLKHCRWMRERAAEEGIELPPRAL